MDKADLVFEIGTEELPPKALKKLSVALGASVEKQLQEAKLTYAKLRVLATPRRLAFVIEQLVCAQAEQSIERRGPAWQAAFDAEGKATKAALGFAKSCGVAVERLGTIKTNKGKWLAYQLQQAGQTVPQLLPEMIKKALSLLPIPKRMRWGASNLEFVRPVHWVLLLFGGEVIACEILGQTAGKVTYGHRFHAPAAITIDTPMAYVSSLADAKVMVDFDQRRAAIKTQIESAARDVSGSAVVDPELLDEVTGLVEYPNVIVGDFAPAFLDLPKEVLVSSMKKHQKYFHIVDANGQLMAHFITVSNIKSSQPEIIKQGNERVIRPRLEDAVFFWNQDKKQSLAERIPSLKSILFQKSLGTLYDRSQRIKHIALGIGQQHQLEAALITRAGDLCKTDLMTDMVGEFPELQGIMGRYYALESGETAAIAEAIDAHYLPRYSGDALPASRLGQCLALADRMDLLVGIFSLGQKPTGDKDPFGLRRAAIGVIRILIEKKVSVALDQMLDLAISQMPDEIKDASVKAGVLAYLLERLRGYYAEQKISVDIFDAVAVCQTQDLGDLNDRMAAVVAFKALPEASSLAAANKRVSNILRKTEEVFPAEVDTDQLIEPAERALYDALKAQQTAVAPRLQKHEYTQALSDMAQLNTVIDAFFKDVMVMVEETALRHNRLALLQQMSQLFLNIADVSKLQS